MDCRQSLLIAFCLGIGCCGCVNTDKRPAPPPVTTDSIPKGAIKKEAGPKRQPKADTLVKWATCKVESASKQETSHSDQMNLRDDARKAFQQALQIDPNHLPAYLGLAALYMQMNDPARAVATYRQGLERHPKEPSLWADLGLCFAKQKDFAQAVNCLEKAMELDPENRRVLQPLAICLAMTGRLDDAFGCLSRVFGPTHAHVQIARIMLRMQRPDLAYDHVQFSLRLDPNFGPAREMLNHLEAAARPPQPPRIGFSDAFNSQ